MNLYSYITSPLLSLILTLILVYPLRTFAIKMQLVDKPNNRKVHKNHVPLIGGILVTVSASLALLISTNFWNNIQAFYTLIIGSAILLIVGILDDKINVDALLKLIIQISIAHLVYKSGIKIDSMYGLFSIYELPIVFQHLITVVIIVGVINAFNLMDGIDGLAAGLAIVGLVAYAGIAFILNNNYLFLIFISMIGALVGFLRFNLSHKNKIFMGDAGSLVLGFLLVVSGIMLIQSAAHTMNVSITLGVVIGVLILPVADSIRVYYKRIKNGNSPFTPDRTHIHHLTLHFNISHKMASLLITMFSILLVVISIFGSTFDIATNVFAVFILFAIGLSVLTVNRNLIIWKGKLKELEMH